MLLLLVLIVSNMNGYARWHSSCWSCSFSFVIPLFCCYHHCCFAAVVQRFLTCHLRRSCFQLATVCLPLLLWSCCFECSLPCYGCAMLVFWATALLLLFVAMAAVLVASMLVTLVQILNYVVAAITPWLQAYVCVCVCVCVSCRFY